MFELIVSWIDLGDAAEALGVDPDDMDASDIDLGEESKQALGVFCIRDEHFSERNLNALEQLRKKNIPFYGCYQVIDGHAGKMFCSPGQEVIWFSPCGKQYSLQVGLDERGNLDPELMIGARLALENLNRAREKVRSRGLETKR